MQAIEFEAHLKDGVIQLPPAYQHWHEDQPVKVIVLAAETDESKNKDINRHAGKIGLTQDPLVFQDVVRDEWT
ncbi:conserved hypothetical protein [Thiocapsa sp. KS1]|jgi:hypothetical protein|nr:hypothetical protein [Thiocapsa sp. KS1]CRI64749.1 conserved hypothetical protein [Thiocapsa sp. KS1]